MVRHICTAIRPAKRLTVAMVTGIAGLLLGGATPPPVMDEFSHLLSTAQTPQTRMDQPSPIDQEAAREAHFKAKIKSLDGVEVARIAVIRAELSRVKLSLSALEKKQAALGEERARVAEALAEERLAAEGRLAEVEKALLAPPVMTTVKGVGQVANGFRLELNSADVQQLPLSPMPLEQPVPFAVPAPEKADTCEEPPLPLN